MSFSDTLLPTRRPDLVIRPLGDAGRYVVKDPQSGQFYQLGEQEHFLLLQLDGEQVASEVCAAFADRFDEPLSAADLEAFLQMAEAQGLLESATCVSSDRESLSGAASPPSKPQSEIPNPQSTQTLLHWRVKLFDPDRLFNWLEPRIRFVWTPWFLGVSAASILLATLVLVANSHELASSFKDALRLETAVWVWLTMFLVITLHEFAHGLTCKHFGGEVREIGFLMMFFIPCLYCNVSDAWLFRERSKRLWVTFAGGYFQLFLWSMAVFIWRVTLPGTFPHYLSFLVVTYCGIDTLFNFNPLIKLDGYYLLSDWLEVPNLHDRGTNRFKAHLRQWLWGSPRPVSEPRGRTLFAYGIVSWLYGLAFLIVILWGMFSFMGQRWGVMGMSGVAVIGLVSTRGMLKQTAAGEARRMFTKRHKRLAVWLAALAGVAAALCLVKIDETVQGRFLVRPSVRAELRSRASGFLQEVHVDEGDRASADSVVATLDIPDLASRIAQKQAEIREAQASLRLLEIGERPEQVAQQRERVERAEKWRDLGRQDLDRMRQILADELTSLQTQIAACQAEVEAAEQSYERAESLVQRNAVAVEEFQRATGNYRVAQARLQQAEAEHRARQAQGTLEAETELARRQRELEDAQAALELLQAGSRPEEIEAERARLARLEEEARCLAELRERLTVKSPVGGLVVTPRLKEKIGQYVHEGDVIGVVEEPAGADIEVTLAEQDASRVRVGHTASLKARALPFEKFQTVVERIAPAAGQGEVQSTVMVYCGSGDLPHDLRPGMSGYARIRTGRQSVGQALINKIVRYVRTEIWFCW